ncbi:MAG: MFS transporter [Deltaproteobacteria bacterium]|nr:MFS transporter [Deltaproteobacteria bacterium]
MTDSSLQRAALTLAVISSFVTPVMASAVNLALPDLGLRFALDAVTLSWVQTGYLLSTAVCVVPAGRLGDIWGRKKMFTWGMAGFGLASLLACLAPSIVVVLVARVAQGVGSAMVFATGMAILSEAYPPGQRGRALGINVAAIYIGLSLGPLLGGVLTHYLTWRGVFALVVPPSALAVWVAVYKLDAEWAEAKGEPFDLVGSFFYALALVGLILGLTRMPTWAGGGLALVGLAFLWLFGWWEGKTQSPVFPVHLIRTNRPFAFSSLAALINYAAIFAVTFLLSLYLQRVKGFDASMAGLILVAQPVMQAMLSPLAGRVSDRVQPRLVASLGMGLTALGLAGLALLDAQSSTIYIVACLMLNGIGFGVFSSPNMNAIMSSVAPRYYGIASGTVAAMRMMGQMVSMGIAASMLAIFVGQVQITPASYPALLSSLQATFIICCLLCVAGIFASLSRGELPKG